MSKKKNRRDKKRVHSSSISAITTRVKYSEEKKYPWLTILLDSYAIHDTEIVKDITREERARRTKVACHKGCHACCLRSKVPVLEPELRGISWYITEVLDNDIQDKLIPRLLNQHESLACPMLLDGICSIYPVRPLACRGFLVYAKPCEIDEDPYTTRREDIHPPNRRLTRQVALRFLDLYGYETIAEKSIAFEQGVMLENVRAMHELDLSGIVELILLFQKQRENI